MIWRLFPTILTYFAGSVGFSTSFLQEPCKLWHCLGRNFPLSRLHHLSEINFTEERNVLIIVARLTWAVLEGMREWELVCGTRMNSFPEASDYYAENWRITSYPGDDSLWEENNSMWKGQKRKASPHWRSQKMRVAGTKNTRRGVVEGVVNEPLCKAWHVL